MEEQGAGVVAEVTLADASTAMMWPLLPSDREALRVAHRNLSPASVYQRYLRAVPELSLGMLRRLVDTVDGHDHVALVMIHFEPDGRDAAIGVAHLIRYPDEPTEADVAVTIVEGFRGRGAATALLTELVRRRPPGIRRVRTVVAEGNPASLRLLAKLGEPVVSTSHGVHTVTVDLAPLATPCSTPITRTGAAPGEAGEAMRLLAISDTHVPTRAKTLPAAVWQQVEEADVVVHAGDWVDEMLLDEIQARSHRLVAVHGNNDHGPLRQRLPEVVRVELGGVRIGVVHETGPAQGRERRCSQRFPDVDVLVFGHSHIPWDTTSPAGLRLLNPGSPTDRRRQPYATYMTARAGDGALHQVALHRLPR